MDELVTLMLVAVEGAEYLVSCPSRAVKTGMVAEFDGYVGCVRAVVGCKPGSPFYKFACRMARQDDAFEADRVYSQCWEACPG